MQKWFESQWQKIGIAQLLLQPISWVFALITAVRRYAYQQGFLSSHALAVPVIVVGNISVGGTGKTPLVIYLAEQLKAQGYQPGIISRGYGGTQSGQVLPNSQPAHFGDEPVLIAKRTACPVWVNVNRVAAGQALLFAHPDCNVIISDDGLQHYRLQRTIEIAVVNSKHAFGNGFLLPAGPLREIPARLSKTDIVVDTGKYGLNRRLPNIKLPPVFNMSLLMQGILSLDDQRKTTLMQLQKKNVVAIAGIGHPERFFNFIKGLGLQCEMMAFNDHHTFSQQDFDAIQDKTILMTEKDAVKCKHLTLKDAWYLPVSAKLTSQNNQQTIMDLIIEKLNRFNSIVLKDNNGS